MRLNNFFMRREAKNASWLIFGRVGQAILGFVIILLTARYLGPANYGVISYAASVIAFVSPIINLGISNVLVQELTNHPDEEGKIIGTSILLSVCSSFACIAGVTTYTLLVDAGETVTNTVVCLYSITLFFQAFELVQYWFQYKLLSKYQAIISLISYFIVSAYRIFLLIDKANVYFFALAYSIDCIIIASLMLIVYRKLGGQHLSFSGTIGKRLFSSSKHYILSGLMITIFSQTDKIMLKLMIDETAVGQYTAAVSCAGLTSFVFLAIIDSFRPTIFQRKKVGTEDEYQKAISQLYCIVIYLALLQSVFMTLFAPFIIRIIYGLAFLPSVTALQIVVWYTTFSYMGSIRDIWVLGENKQRYLWIIYMGGAVLNILMNYALIPIWGIYGAATASLVTQVFSNVIMNIIVLPFRHNNTLIWKGLNPKILFSLFNEK